MSTNLPVQSVALARIAELDENFWYSDQRAVPTCRSVVEHCRLIAEADLNYPIILDQAGRVMDGMHRVCKAQLLGINELRAVQFIQDPEPDFVGREPESLPYS